MKSFIAAGLLLLMTVACSIPVQEIPTPTANPTSTKTATPTASPLPPSETPEVSSVSEWEGIPLMPGAMAGEGDEEGYVFTIQASAQQVQEYYQIELGKLGWQPFSQESGESSLTLIFMDSASVTLTISILSRGEQSLVLLVK